MSLLRADKIANRLNNGGPIIVGPSTVSGSFTVTGIATVLGLGVTNNVLVGNGLTANYLTATNGASFFNSNLTGITTAGIVTGATYYGNGVNLTGVVTSVTAGAGVQISPVSGQGRVTISATGVAVAGYATNAGLATDVKGGTAGAVLYQAGANDTAFTAVGSAGEILQSNGTSAPTWVNLAAINVSFADSAGISTNLKGGSAGRIPVQSGIDQTTFMPVGVSGNILLAQGTSTPIFIDPKAQLDVRRARFAGIATNLQSGYISAATSLEVIGVTTLGVATAKTLDVTGITTTKDLVVTGVSTFQGNAVFSGITSVGTAITMYGQTGIVSATAFYGDGSNLTNVQGISSISNQLYVTPDGNDINDGRTANTAKRTVGSALTVARSSTVINIFGGTYVEDNPVVLPEQVTLLGDSLREVSIVPQNSNADLIYVSNGSYVENMSFTGTLNEGKAIISFNPDKPSYVTQGPYIRNCTNFISNSIGMKIDGASVIGPTRAMNVDSYTQLNQGGIGVSISNEGYAQLVSIFTIYNDQSIVCTSGGQCDLTNSNSSFGRLGLVADGIGPTNFIGTVTEAKDANTNIFPIDLSVETVSISDAAYDAATGLTTITTHKAHGFTQGMSINLAGLGFTCPPYPHTFDSGVTNAITNTGVSNRFQAQAGTTYDPATGLLVLNIGSGHGQTADTELTATTGTAYNPSTGILTVVTTASHGMATGDYVKIVEGSLRFTCATDGNATNHDYPRATDPVNNKWKQVIVTNATTFTMNIGKSSDTSLHTWVSAVANGVLKANSLITIVDSGVTFTCATDGNATNHSYPRFTDPASSKVFGVEAVTTDTITLNIGKSSDTSTHTFVSGVADAIVARTKAASYTAVVGTTYDGPTGSLVLDVNTTHGLTAATALTAGSGTTYEPTTGLLTVVTTGAHGMTTGDFVKFDKQSLTFTCTSDGNTAQIAYPRTTDPVFNKWKQVTVVNATTFTVLIGKTITGNYPHTWVSATTGGVKKANSLISLTDNSVSFTCTKDNNTVVKSYPAYTDPASCRILGVEAVTSDTITINVGPANLATFPDNFGRVFTVKQVNSTTQYETFVGVSTIIHGYDSGGNTNIYVTRPFDGQVVYLDELYNSISGVTITNGGSGYTTPPVVTFSAPSESWGITATGVARLTNGVVTSIDMISNGRGYTGTPTVNIDGAASGTPEILPTYYVVSSSTPVVGGISTVTFTENVPYAVGVGSTVPFFKQSRVLASSQAFEYIGSGNTFPDALPARGGVAIPENEIVNKNGGLVIFTSTDQAGNFKIGEGVVINQLEGSITGDAYNRSLFANITPYILALGGGD